MTIHKINKGKSPKLIIVTTDNATQNTSALISRYLLPLSDLKSEVQIISVPLAKDGKVKKDDFVREWEDIVEYAETVGCTNVAVTIPMYMKFITKSKKAYKFELAQGTKEIVAGLTIFPLLNYQVLSFNPDKLKLLMRALNYIYAFITGTLKEEKDAKDIKYNLTYATPKAVKEALNKLQKYDELTCDIETTGLNFAKDRLLTVSFACNKDCAVNFAIHPQYHAQDTSKEIIKLLKEFFIEYNKKGGKIIGHNFMSFDLAFVVYQIMCEDEFTDDFYDIINSFNIIDTLVMAYLVHNSTDRPPLGLKELAYSVMGNYDGNVDQRVLIKYPLETVATYNNLDCIANWYIYDTLKEQVKPRLELFEEYKSIGKDILKMKMNGFKVDLEQVDKASKELVELIENAKSNLRSKEAIIETERRLNTQASKKYNNAHIKQKSPDEFDIEFLAGSSQHKEILFADVLKVDAIKISSKTKRPSYDKEVLKTYKSEDYDEEVREIAELLLDFNEAKKVDSGFLKAFQKYGVSNSEDDCRLYCHYSLNGTVSGRMSSNTPNLLNLPSNSTYGKLVKSCFNTPKGFIMAGADFSSLEEVQLVNASKDPAKYRIFAEGFDSHSFNAYHVCFKDELERRGIDINPDDPESINSIKKLAPDLRQRTKPVAFAMNYLGTHITVMKQLKCSEQEAQDIVAKYKEVYSGVQKYYDENIEFAQENGYVVSPFTGLFLRTPNINATDQQAVEKEIRTLCNFLIQSSGFITLRAITRIQKWIEDNNYTNDIKIVNSIYDSIYFYVKDDVELIEKFNKIVVDLMTIPVFDDELLHNKTELEIGYRWDKLRTISNNASTEEILKTLKDS